MLHLIQHGELCDCVIVSRVSKAQSSSPPMVDQDLDGCSGARHQCKSVPVRLCQARSEADR